MICTATILYNRKASYLWVENMTEKYTLDSIENKAFLKSGAQALLTFGRHFPAPGGSSYYLGDNGMPQTEKSRETWFTARMVHVYSIGAMLGFSDGVNLAAAGIKGLSGELCDREYGGYYAGINADGSILPGKHCYAHAFVILAATSACLASIEGAEALLENALRQYDTLFWDEKEGLSADAWDTQVTCLDPYRGLNANMHSVEAFLAVADAMEDENTKEIYRTRCRRIIDRVLGWASDNDYRIPEHFTKNWEPEYEKNKERPDDPFKPYGATPGHGIEWARLILQWSLSANTEKQDYYTDAACRLYERAKSDAWFSDGTPGFVYTTDWNGQPVVRDRMHWVLAEAINTSAVLYRVTREQKFADDFAAYLQYLDQTMLDHGCGSWYHQLDEKNRPKSTVWPGKPDLYHAFQAMLIPYAAPSVSIAKALSREKTAPIPAIQKSVPISFHI